MSACLKFKRIFFIKITFLPLSRVLDVVRPSKYHFRALRIFKSSHFYDCSVPVNVFYNLMVQARFIILGKVNVKMHKKIIFLTKKKAKESVH